MKKVFGICHTSDIHPIEPRIINGHLCTKAMVCHEDHSKRSKAPIRECRPLSEVRRSRKNR